MRYRVPLAAAFVALAGLVSGCSGGGGGPVSTTSVAPATSSAVATSSATPTPTPTPTPTQSDADAALAAVERYFVAFNRSVKTRDSTEFRATFAGWCEVCQRDAKKIDDLRSAGRTLEGNELSFESPRVESVQAVDAIMTIGTLKTAAGTLRDSSGKVLQTFTEGALTTRLLVRKVGGQWLVSGVF